MILTLSEFRKACATTVVVLGVSLQVVPASADDSILTSPVSARANHGRDIILPAITGNGGIKPGTILVVTENGTQPVRAAELVPKHALMRLAPGDPCVTR